MSAPDRDEPFLRRWSRRKAEARQEDTPAAEPDQQESAAPPPGEAPAVDPAELPDPDSLDKDADFSVFMREGVPEELRRRALRRLWRTDPVFANLDGLNDYDGDFTGAGMPLGAAVRTAWRVGRGFVEDDAEDEDEAPSGEAAQSTQGESKTTEGEEKVSDPTDDAVDPGESRQA